MTLGQQREQAPCHRPQARVQSGDLAVGGTALHAAVGGTALHAAVGGTALHAAALTLLLSFRRAFKSEHTCGKEVLDFSRGVSLYSPEIERAVSDPGKHSTPICLDEPTSLTEDITAVLISR